MLGRAGALSAEQEALTGQRWVEARQGRPRVSVLKLEEALGNGTSRSLSHSRRFSLAATSPLLVRLIPGLVARP